MAKYVLPFLLFVALLFMSSCGAGGAASSDDDSGLPSIPSVPTLPPPDDVLLVDIDATGAETGLSWADAYTNLREALLTASLDSHYTEIWVAEGTYLPSLVQSRTEYFIMVPNVDVLGGFAGIESTKDQRDPLTHLTILSGDHLGDSTGDAGAQTDAGRDDDAIHIVVGRENALIDGFTITHGNATGTDAWGLGNYGGGILHIFEPGFVVNNCVIANCRAKNAAGGMHVQHTDGMITNSTVTNCYAGTDGGGMVFYQTSSTLINTTLSSNGSYNSGAGFHVHTDATVTASACLFEHNTSRSGGGAINSYKGSVILDDCDFETNHNSSTTYSAGGIQITTGHVTATNCRFDDSHIYEQYCPNNSYTNCVITNAPSHAYFSEGGNTTLKNCTFSNSEGGIFVRGGGSYAFIDCIISGNTDDYGAGAWVGATDATFVRCQFLNNTATVASTTGGSAIRSSSATMFLESCVFKGNISHHSTMFLDYTTATFNNCLWAENTGDYGIVMAAYWNADITIANCTMANNTGRPFYMLNNCLVEMQNSLVADNSIPNFAINNVGTVTSTNCCIESSGGSSAWNTNYGTNAGGNIDVDPLFAGATDYHLTPSSPCIDAGNNTKILADTHDLDLDLNVSEDTPFDLDGDARQLSGLVDIGAYEFDSVAGSVLVPMGIN